MAGGAGNFLVDWLDPVKPGATIPNMGFWSWVRNGSLADVPNSNPPPGTVGEGYNPGDPEGLDLSSFAEPTEARALPWVQPSAWSGWPAEWDTPQFNLQSNFNKLIDVAWACLDLNSSILSSMPVYRMRGGRVIEPTTWMRNPDPLIYTSWQEFAKQLIWDYMLGEAFILPMSHDADGAPQRFRVIPPWLVNAEMAPGGTRSYRLGPHDVTDEILHIRYKSSTDSPRGIGPLESAGARVITVKLLQRYTDHIAETGGVPLWWLEVERRINSSEGRDILDRWIESRQKYAGYPALVSAGAKLNQSKTMNASDMMLLELTQFSEARIAILLGVPPFLVGLPGATGSLTYSNIESLFDFHDRSSLRPKAKAVMEALSGWALPRGQSVELNRDDYTRPGLRDRAMAYEALVRAGILHPEEGRAMERLYNPAAAQQLTGLGYASAEPSSEETVPPPPNPRPSGSSTESPSRREPNTADVRRPRGPGYIKVAH